MYTLFIGNKNYSTWSMRPWILLKQAGIDFHEHLIQFDSFEPDSQFKTEILKLNPTGKVPTLVDADITVWDSLAICEYVAEQHPEKNCCRKIRNYVLERVVLVLKCIAVFKTYVIFVR